MCYNHGNEVSNMENNEQNLPEEELTEVQQEPIPKKQGYSPRPAWQVWLARISLVIFILVLIVYYMVYFRGGR